jgi:hypothetical protein
LRTGQAARVEAVLAACFQRNALDQQAWAYLALAWRITQDVRFPWLVDDRLIQSCALNLSKLELATLASDLQSMHHARQAPLEQSVRGGSQTPGRLFGRSFASIQQLERLIHAEISRVISKFTPDVDHPFLSRLRHPFRMGGSWSVSLQSSGKHATELGLNLAPLKLIKPEPGMLVLFPSFFWHGTVPFESAISRLTVAFDVESLPHRL